MNLKSLSSHKKQEPESSVLYIVGTPIGNLNDLSLRAINILKNVSLIACEDTRQTKKIMSKYEFKNNLISFNIHNSSNKTPKIIEYLKDGRSIGLVSDAGLPSICDPGEDLVKECKANGLNVICIPGPCAALTALVSSGLPSSTFTFEGFLPKKKSEREKILKEISNNYKTTIVYEAPHRLKRLLIELKEYCGGDRKMQVFRELTKKFEENIGDDVDKILNFFENKEIRGEFTIVVSGLIKPIQNDEFNKVELKQELHELTNAGLSLSAASKYLARKKNLKKGEIYDLY